MGLSKFPETAQKIWIQKNHFKEEVIDRREINENK
jgi:hypothetical protein